MLSTTDFDLKEIVKEKIQPLISIEELKVMKTFKSTILIPRMMLFKTKLLLDYKIDWNLEKKELDMPTRKITETSIYKF